jgi:hypothetical protein
MSTSAVDDKNLQRHRSKWQHYWELLWFKVYTDLKIETQITLMFQQTLLL